MRFAVMDDKLIPAPLLAEDVPTFPISYINHFREKLPLNPNFSPDPDLKNLLTGKQLLPDDLPHSIEELHAHYENGFLIFRKGIIFERKKARCRRCGNSDRRFFASYPCFRCGEKCLYCRKCLMMGRISTCTPLISWREEVGGFVVTRQSEQTCRPIQTGTVQTGYSLQTGRSSEIGPLLIKQPSVSVNHLSLFENRSSSENQPPVPEHPLTVLENQPSAFENQPSAFENRQSASKNQAFIVENKPLQPSVFINLSSLTENHSASSENQVFVLEEPPANEKQLSVFKNQSSLSERHPVSSGNRLSASEKDLFASDKRSFVLQKQPSVFKNQPSVSVRSAVSLVWDGTLSPGQKVASDRVVEAISDNGELLVWAVCGAGKTEVLFAGIERALKDGKRVCVATPRTDVVLELTPRLKKVFPGTEIAALYGGSEDRLLYAPLTICTTHQLLRFYKAFDTVILDEVDAFPYTVEEALPYAVRNARKVVSSMIYLTATPNEKWQRECRAGKRACVTIPARYHRHPLPVPRLVWCGNWQKLLGKNKLPSNVLKWLHARLAANKQVLLFVPKIALLEKILPVLRLLHPDIETVYAEDPDRKEKVQMMRDKKLLMLVTTTILERGVTFPNIDVAVLGAENRIFTESALVQIAGRAGRSALYPKGDVVFFHYGRTVAMNKARKQILAMNREAAEKGLVDPE